MVITDVIMPGRDGYEVCQYIKQHPRFSQTPVILMSGVVNKGVAERAFAVHANELIRKPFQPQDLIARVRHLLSGPVEAEPAHEQANEQVYKDASAVLSSIFSGPMPPRTGHGASRITGPVPVSAAVAPRAPGTIHCGHRGGRADAAGSGARRSPFPAPRSPVRRRFPCPRPSPDEFLLRRMPGNSSDAGRMRLEILRLHSQIKKLEAELVAEREYSKALEQHVTSLQESE